MFSVPRYDPGKRPSPEKKNKSKKKRKKSLSHEHSVQSSGHKPTHEQLSIHHEGEGSSKISTSINRDDSEDLTKPTSQENGDTQASMEVTQEDIQILETNETLHDDDEEDQEPDKLSSIDQIEVKRALRVAELPIDDVAQTWKLAPFLVKNLKRDGFESFFPIQALSIPDIITSERHPYVRARDICISARTGSGKTLAYLLPILNALSGRKIRRLSALIILPSRDLAMQVHSVLQSYVENSDLKAGLAVGQSDFAAEQESLTIDRDASDIRSLNQKLMLERSNLDLALAVHGGINDIQISQKRIDHAVDILVCTPGRLMMHLDETPGFSLKYLKFLVVDEADRLLSERYQNWVDRVTKAAGVNDAKSSINDLTGPERLHHVPLDPIRGNSRRLNLSSSGSSFADSVRRPVQLRKFLVSATMTRDPQKLASLGLINPKFFDVNQLSGKGQSEKFSVPPKLEEFTVVCTAEQKPVVLCASILQERQRQEKGIIVVFTASVESTHRLARLLQLIWEAAGYGKQTAVTEFSSALSQEQRSALVSRSKESDCDIEVIVCSDGMSRGIDIENVTMVINYDVPRLAKQYVHRIGRTARAGKSGKSVSVLKHDQVGPFKRMRRNILNPERVQVTEVDKSQARRVVPVYKECLANLRAVLEAETDGEISPLDTIPEDIYHANKDDGDDHF